MAPRGYRDCPFCAEPARHAAKVCPHCRRDLPAKRKSSGKLWLLIVGIFVLFVLAKGGERETQDQQDEVTASEVSQASSAVTAHADVAPVVDTSEASATGTKVAADDGWHTLASDWLACKQRETQEKLDDFRVSNDREAFKAYGLQALLAGECRYLKEGADVHVDEDSVWYGMACLRPRGKTVCLWANRKATEG